MVKAVFVLLCSIGLLFCSRSAWALEINTASRAQLEQLNGIGVAAAERILAERSKAPFRDWDDLRARVKGIGAKRALSLAARGLTVNGNPLPAARSKEP